MGKLKPDEIEIAVAKFIQLKFYTLDEEAYNHPNPKQTLQYQTGEWDDYILYYKQQLKKKKHLKIIGNPLYYC